MDAARRPLSTLERCGVLVCLGVVLAFGIVVEYRSALLSRRMGDLTCFLRGAWAVRAGTNLYEITDNNGWHYNYPPFFAIMMVPLADPPRGTEADFVLPHAVTAALWYAINILLLVWIAHSLASILETYSETLRDRPRFCRRWWALRLWPTLVCLPPIGHTLMRGQVGLVVLAPLCAMTICFVRGQSFRAGVWLATAAAIKLIPGFLVIYPLVRRDVRCFGGMAAGALATLVIIPVLALGPQGTIDNYKSFTHKMLAPAMEMGGDSSRQVELLNARTTDNQCLANAMFNIRYPNVFERPPVVEPWAKWTSRVLGVLMTGLTLLAGYRARLKPGWPLVLFLGAMIYLMTILSPVAHLHYFLNALPMVVALFAARWEQEPRSLWPGNGLITLSAVFVLANIIPQIPTFAAVRDVGLPLFAGMGLWTAAIVRLWRDVPAQQVAEMPVRLAA